MTDHYVPGELCISRTQHVITVIACAEQASPTLKGSGWVPDVVEMLTASPHNGRSHVVHEQCSSLTLSKRLSGGRSRQLWRPKCSG